MHASACSCTSARIQRNTGLPKASAVVARSSDAMLLSTAVSSREHASLVKQELGTHSPNMPCNSFAAPVPAHRLSQEVSQGVLLALVSYRLGPWSGVWTQSLPILLPILLHDVFSV